jgi:hypothetical protein
VQDPARLQRTLEPVCQGLSITPEQLRQHLQAGGDLQDLASGALTPKGLRIAALALRHIDTAFDDPLPDPKAEAKRQELLAMLTQEPGIHYSFATDDERESDHVVLATSIRGKATCELRISKERYDGIAVLELIEKRTGNKKE